MAATELFPSPTPYITPPFTENYTAPPVLVVAGSVAGAMLVLLVLSAVSVLCYCSYRMATVRTGSYQTGEGLQQTESNLPHFSASLQTVLSVNTYSNENLTPPTSSSKELYI